VNEGVDPFGLADLDAVEEAQERPGVLPSNAMSQAEAAPASAPRFHPAGEGTEQRLRPVEGRPGAGAHDVPAVAAHRSRDPGDGHGEEGGAVGLRSGLSGSRLVRGAGARLHDQIATAPSGDGIDLLVPTSLIGDGCDHDMARRHGGRRVGRLVGSDLHQGLRLRRAAVPDGEAPPAAQQGAHHRGAQLPVPITVTSHLRGFLRRDSASLRRRLVVAVERDLRRTRGCIRGPRNRHALGTEPQRSGR
jgi:hypothetical protein